MTKEIDKRELAILSDVFATVASEILNSLIIPLALVGSEMIIATSALRASLAIYHLISNAHSWNNC